MEFHAALSRCVWLTLLYVRANITSKGAAEGVWRRRVSAGWRVRRRREEAERNAGLAEFTARRSPTLGWGLQIYMANNFIKGVENAAQKQAAMSGHVLRLICLTFRGKKKSYSVDIRRRCLSGENTQRHDKLESYFRETWPIMFVFAAIIHISLNCGDCISL